MMKTVELGDILCSSLMKANVLIEGVCSCRFAFL